MAPSSEKLTGGYKLLWRVLNAPKPIRSGFSRSISSLLYLAQKKRLHKRVQTIFPQYDASQVKAVAKDSTRFACDEIINMLQIPAENYRVVGAELLPEAGTQGAVFASVHIGQTEAPTYAIQQLGHEVCTIIGAGDDNPQLHHLGAAMLEQTGLPYLTKNKGILFDLIAKLHKKHCVFIHSDLRDKGPEVEFLGQKTTVPKTAASLAVLAKVPLYFIYGIREQDELVVYIDKLADVDEVQGLQMPREEALSLLTQRLVESMEQVIRRYPQYWLWLYNRFRIK
ncbi:lysophospholipid acyltransferase family protein [Bacterioplanoides sp.]|uniref:lysophospholipid acyltransferase family protein n=1 Tax=Bacterioplanoides sp. TaxID=2066072 RepID=UPI003B5A7F35